MSEIVENKKAVANVEKIDAKSKKSKNVAKKVIVENQQSTIMKDNMVKNAENTNTRETFYLEEKVTKLLNESESRRKIEIEKVSKECEKEEIKGQKYIEALKAEMLERYKLEQNKCQKKIENLKTKAMKKIEDRIKKEQNLINEMCKKEILSAINKYAMEKGWFELGVELYKSKPDLFV